MAHRHQPTRASAAAALEGQHATARALHRKDARAVTADEESFTAVWKHAARSMVTPRRLSPPPRNSGTPSKFPGVGPSF